MNGTGQASPSQTFRINCNNSEPVRNENHHNGNNCKEKINVSGLKKVSTEARNAQEYLLV
jgi:hypothetical protein